jgi:hypothetical protein
MESKQKYIEVEEPYEIDEVFVDAIMEIPHRDRVRVLQQISESIEKFEYNEDETSEAAGRIGSEFYYKIEYYNTRGWTPVLLDFYAVDVDDYLDMMVDKKLILK